MRHAGGVGIRDSFAERRPNYKQGFKIAGEASARNPTRDRAQLHREPKRRGAGDAGESRAGDLPEPSSPLGYQNNKLEHTIRAYQDKLDGKISEDFWTRKSEEWQTEEQQIRSAIQALELDKPERMVNAVRILELANKAYFLYLKQSAAEKAKLIKMVLSNCSIDATNLYPTYRKPFDLIFARAKMRNGAPGEIRTPDLLVRSQTLYPAELRAR